MNIALTGASGFIGSRLAELAAQKNHRVIGFTRNPKKPIPHCAETRAFAISETDEPLDLSGCDAIVNLAGENVFGIWTAEKKRRIRKSRIAGTRALVNAITAADQPPTVMVSGSAIGFYGDTGENETDENARSGDGFLAEVTRDWEIEALRAEQKKVRVVLLRTSIVLGKTGGALQKMLTPFRLGLGGKLGSGSQWMSWIHRDDIANLILFALENNAVSGPLNACAPEPIRNVDFTRALAKAVHRPAIIPAPAFVLKAMLGEFSRELLDSKRILPVCALKAGFQFQYPQIKTALTAIITGIDD